MELVDKALALDPGGRSLSIVGEAQLLLGEYRRSVASLEKAKGLGLNELMIYLFLSAGYAHIEELDNAAAARNDVLRLVPGYTIASHKSQGLLDER